MRSLTAESVSSFVEALRTWAAYDRHLRSAVSSSYPDWRPARQLIAAAAGLFHEKAERFRLLLAESNQQLHPLTDPLTEDFGTHRWLAADRDESYSDWLEWIVRQLGTAGAVFRLFRVTDDRDDWRDLPVTVGRELPVPAGHAGKTGRLDLWIRIAGRALIVVEVKKTDADSSDTIKHAGYMQWIGSQPEPIRVAVLLASGGEEESYDGFPLLTWGSVCVSLRGMVPGLYATRKVTLAAMILAFVGAVEQNLLGYSSSAIRGIIEGRVATFNTELVDHLEQAVSQGRSLQ